jgi:uncharacterized protein involved in exopolysaccharide biosynthesis
MTSIRTDAAVDQVSFFDLLTPLVLRWRIVAACATAGALAGLALGLLEHARFTAAATFTTQPSGSGVTLPSGIAGLAGQFGLSLPSAATGSSPAFFVDLIQARGILRKLVLSRFPDPDSLPGTAPVRLVDQLAPRGKTWDVRLDKAIEIVSRMVQANVGKTGIVRLEVVDRSPERGAGIANRVVALVDTFNLERLRLQSRQQHRFTEERLSEAKSDLQQAEDQQLRFLATNRLVTQSPVLRYEAARLERNVQMKSELMLTLTRANEEAKLSESRNVPTITLVDSAEAPVRKSGPKRKLLLLVGGVLGLVFGSLAAYLRHMTAEMAAARHPDYEAFTQALHRVTAELPWTGRTRAG